MSNSDIFVLWKGRDRLFVFTCNGAECQKTHSPKIDTVPSTTATLQQRYHREKEKSTTMAKTLIRTTANMLLYVLSTVSKFHIEKLAKNNINNGAAQRVVKNRSNHQ